MKIDIDLEQRYNFKNLSSLDSTHRYVVGNIHYEYNDETSYADDYNAIHPTKIFTKYGPAYEYWLVSEITHYLSENVKLSEYCYESDELIHDATRLVDFLLLNGFSLDPELPDNGEVNVFCSDDELIKHIFDVSAAADIVRSNWTCKQWDQFISYMSIRFSNIIAVPK